jgi:hypothetical protein
VDAMTWTRPMAWIAVLIMLFVALTFLGLAEG